MTLREQGGVLTRLSLAFLPLLACLQVRWALQRIEPNATPAMKIHQEWAADLAAWPADKRGPLLQALAEQREDHPAEADKFGGADRAYKDDAAILSLAMHDTTAATISLTLMELAMRPQLQAQVAAEARAVLFERGNPRAMAYDDLAAMPLLTKCINETLRE
jgi:cytochrome P450